MKSKYMEFYCKYCDTTQFLQKRDDRVTCGNKNCIKDRQNEKARERRKRTSIKKAKVERVIHSTIKEETKGGDSYSVIVTECIQSHAQYRPYKTNTKVSDVKGYKKLFVFGRNYPILTKLSTEKYVITSSIAGTFIVLLDGEVQIRDHKDPYKGLAC